MSIQIHNTLTNTKEEFVPLHAGEVRMYCCGPTVYNYFHIGNARPFVFFDTVRRYLAYKGYRVTFVQNFTDVDDKIIKRCNEEHISPKELTDRFIAEYFTDADALGVQRADVHPRVSEHMDDIIAMIQTLLDKGHAYNVGGNVYFDVASDPEYGKLSSQSLDDLMSGARIEVNQEKKNPLDFALWKKRKEGEPYWSAPFGEGRPGWHIECSAMSKHYLGDTIDIHGGGEDLVFPHHENEVAQSECASGKPFVRYFMHNAYLNIDGKKMGKSLNNFLMVRDISKQFDLGAVRLFLLSAHYRTPLNFTKEQIASSLSALKRLRNLADQFDFWLQHAPASALGPQHTQILDAISAFQKAFESAMDDDFNTANALASLFDLTKYCNTHLNEHSPQALIQKAKDCFMRLCDVLGLDVLPKSSILDDEIEELIAQRNAARKQKDYQKSDAIRDLLLQKGVVLQDTREGVKWHRV